MLSNFLAYNEAIAIANLLIEPQRSSLAFSNFFSLLNSTELEPTNIIENIKEKYIQAEKEIEADAEKMVPDLLRENCVQIL